MDEQDRGGTHDVERFEARDDALALRQPVRRRDARDPLTRERAQSGLAERGGVGIRATGGLRPQIAIRLRSTAPQLSAHCSGRATVSPMSFRA